MTAAFDKWLDKFLDEKELDLDVMFEVEGPEWGLNIIPAAVVVEHMRIAPAREQAKIKDMIVRIDFQNGDVMDYLRHLAGAIAR